MANIYLPTVAAVRSNLEKTLGFLQLLKNKDLTTGLMFLMLDGQKSLEGGQKDSQYENYEWAVRQTGPISVIVMAASSPLSDLDFYHLPEKSVEHVKKAVDFAAGLPGRQDQAIVTFHLNTLMSEVEWRQAGADPEAKLKYWSLIFNKIVWPALKEACAYAQTKNVELKVETTPVPEFGDLSDPALNTLGNPYPLYSGRGYDEIRAQGAGLVLDLCHTYTLYKAAKIIQTENRNSFSIQKGIFPSDIKKLIGKDLMQEVEALREGDVVHLNDSKGIFDPEKLTLHQEGVILGDGEIENLPKIIKKLVSKKIKCIFEINETNYQGEYPNLKKSIKYFLQLI